MFPNTHRTCIPTSLTCMYNDMYNDMLCMYMCVHQVTVDTEVCMLTTDMLHVLFKCFMELTTGAKKEKVSLVVSIILY